MPREIDCPDCEGRGVKGNNLTSTSKYIKCENCEGDGKITVYTETEFNNLKAWNSDLLSQCDELQNDIKKAVQEEREAWIIYMLKIRDLIVERNIDEVYHFIYTLANPMFDKIHPWTEWEAIRQRGNK